jgi:hypothetical protein
MNHKPYFYVPAQLAPVVFCLWSVAIEKLRSLRDNKVLDLATIVSDVSR